MSTQGTHQSFEVAEYRQGHGWRTALPRVLDGPRTLVLAFGDSKFQPEEPAFEDLRRAFPGSILAGCSTSGQIVGTALSDHSMGVGVFRFREAQVRSAVAPVRDASDSRRAGECLAAQLEGASLHAVLVYSDGLRVNGSELTRGLASKLPPGVLVTGGLAGDGMDFKRTWVLHAGQPREGVVAAVGLYGPSLRIGHGCRGGWDAFGPERVVTRSRGNVLYELDGKPALPLYKRYLGDLAAGLPSTALLFPLSIRASRTEAMTLVRSILGVDEREQSLTFAGDIPEGWVAQLMRANLERAISGAAHSADVAGRALGGPCLCIAISCVGRRVVLGERTEEELDAAMNALPWGSAQIGFYSYGEISPAGMSSCELHNQTMTVTTIREV